MKKSLFAATISPLSSIFGSGFLVIVPILAGAVGAHAVEAMALICAVAFLVGAVIRFNIRHAEPVLANTPGKVVLAFERTSDVALVIAYVISVCLYLQILSSFVLRGFDADTEVNMNLMTTAIIGLIVLVGVIKGLKALDALEAWGLGVTFIIITLLIAGFVRFDLIALQSADGFVAPDAEGHSVWEVITILSGALIVVQGFETPRYLSALFDTETRIRASRWSQVIATIVYLAFVAVTLPAVHTLGGDYGSNSLVVLVGTAAGMLAIPLIIAAALSQFSAAVADTHAATGNMAEITNGRVTATFGCVLVGVAAVFLTWSADTLEILALASRAFALYYCLQCLVACCVAKNISQRVAFATMATGLAFITIFAVPAG